MSDFSLKFTAEQLGKDLENLSEELEAELNQAVEDLAQAAYANIVANAQAKLSSTRQDYLKSLQFTNLGDNSYLISLDGDSANSTEDGYGSFDMKEKMLKSDKVVGVGSRAGEPWVKTNKDGGKYAHVPFEHKPFSKSTSGNLANDIKQMVARNRQGREQKLTSIFKDDLGKPLRGKVATAKSDNPLLNQMTKFQHVSEKGAVSSIYMTFRTVGEDSEGWIHPGHPGAHFFQEAEEYVEAELENIIKTLL